ncbi:MAG: hypothetical protein HYZ13_06115 [Acidobacteria bacterium]|nr:hypothetical protein [Acidobacteriota bacterium]
MNAFFEQDPSEPYLSARLYKAYLGATPAPSPYTQFTKQGSLVLMVEIPMAGAWRIRVTDSLFQTKSGVVSVPSSGIYGFQINNVQAGNVRVDLLTHASGAFFRQEPLVVQPSATAGVGIRFVTDPADRKRFVLKHVSVGQGSQATHGFMPLLLGKEAMVRVMLQDSKGEFSPGAPPRDLIFPVRIEYGNPSNGTFSQTVMLRASALPIGTGVVDGTNLPAAIIPGHLIAEGFFLRVKLMDGSGAILDEREAQPWLAKGMFEGRPLVIHPYSIRPPTGGYDYVADPVEFQTKIGRWAAERFPNQGLSVLPVQVVFVRSTRPPWQPPQPDDLLSATLGMMNYLASLQGYTSATQNHIFVGIIDDHYYVSGASGGMASYGRPGVAMHGYNFSDGGNVSGHIFTHEVGHCFGLRHAPSVSGGGIVAGDPDVNYPYSGNGLSSGYAYSPALQFFNREITQNWDHMSYTGPYSNYQRFFSDYNYWQLFNVQLPPFGEPVPVNLSFPQDAQGTFLFGRSETQKLKQWMARNMSEKDICRLGPPMVVGAEGQFLQQASAGLQGNQHLSGFPSMGPASLVPPSKAPPGGSALLGRSGSFECWFHCPHIPIRSQSSRPWLIMTPDAP